MLKVKEEAHSIFLVVITRQASSSSSSPSQDYIQNLTLSLAQKKKV